MTIILVGCVCFNGEVFIQKQYTLCIISDLKQIQTDCLNFILVDSAGPPSSPLPKLPARRRYHRVEPNPGDVPLPPGGYKEDSESPTGNHSCIFIVVGRDFSILFEENKSFL